MPRLRSAKKETIQSADAGPKDEKVPKERTKRATINVTQKAKPSDRKKVTGETSTGKSKKSKNLSETGGSNEEDTVFEPGSGMKKNTTSRGKATEKNGISPKKKQRTMSPEKDEGILSSSEESEWEEVEELEEELDLSNRPSTSSALMHREDTMEITISKPKNKKELDLEAMMRREVNRFRKKLREQVHKAHLLCFMARGLAFSQQANDPLARACALSLVPQGFIDVGQKIAEETVMTKFLKWFRSAIQLSKSKNFAEGTSESTEKRESVNLSECLDSKEARNELERTVAFVCVLRSMGLDARLVFSCTPSSLKLEQIEKPETSKRGSSLKIKKGNKKGEIKSKPSVATSKKEFSWAEIYLGAEERWLALDYILVSTDNCVEIEAKCRQPVHYVLGIDSDDCVKDLTARYSSGFLSSQVRRLRTDGAWWKQTLWKFRSRHRQRDRLEDLQMRNNLGSQPIPNTVAELKNHPLYMIKRDLLKFEAIYPPETKPVGHVRNEPIFPRTAIRTLHSKESWIKDARVIRVGEEPYKIVKARPKIGVPKEKQEPERPLPLFGYWQTEQYIPPPVVNGVIPRNEYGNVEVFKPCMIPPGTVHLHVPGLLQVAKKLDIDCAPAMIGWEFHGRGSHPVLDGWIVCEEHQETLLAAWDHMQAIEDQRNKEKREERVLRNWKRLTKGLILRKKMREKFEQGNSNRIAANNGKNSDWNLHEEGNTLEEQGEEIVSETGDKAAWPRSKREFGISDD